MLASCKSVANLVLLKGSVGMEITVSHAANVTCIMAHALYILSLMPSDFHLFGPLTKHLAGKSLAMQSATS